MNFKTCTNTAKREWRPQTAVSFFELERFQNGTFPANNEVVLISIT